MSKRRKPRPATAGPSAAKRPDAASATPPSRAKLWMFRLLAVVLAPLVFAGLLELALRVAGSGYDTRFLRSLDHNNRECFVQNDQFAWRFLGPEMGRRPQPLCIPRQKPPDTIRIFLFGESAAQGDPLPSFGPARLLQTMLSARHPTTRFEVINAAMTAINSHAVLAIARDCAKADGDIWVIYMGNNEVVGPFGAGTVFGRQTPPLPLIRTTLALKTTRVGQQLDSLLSSLRTGPSETTEWRGMEMFLQQQVRASDPRLPAVYQNFERNLTDMIRLGQQHGLGMVVSTVAVNLRDCAPFASAHRSGLAESDKTRWQQLHQLGLRAQEAGEWKEAAQRFQEAERIDDTFAELRFRQGQCAQALGLAAEDHKHFQAACDLDTLRFRCDSTLNALIRRLATNRAADRILLADVADVFIRQHESGMSDAELFHEHVHPTFRGNHLLARTLAEQVEKLLPDSIRTRNSELPSWLTDTECAQRLVWSDWSEMAALEDILARVSAAPFTGQANHAAQLQSLKSRMENLSPALQPSRISELRTQCEAAATAAPDDPALQSQLAALRLLTGDLTGAATSARRELDLLPHSSQAWVRLGTVLTRQQKHDEAATAFQHAVELDPVDVMHRQHLAQALWLSGRRAEAIAQLRQALKRQPNFSLGWISLGQLQDEAGRRVEAEASYQRALACEPFRTADLLALARFCRVRGWPEAALTNFTRALNLNPQDAMLRLETGQCLLTLRRYAEAENLFAEAVRLAPDSAAARQLYGQALGQQGKTAEAEAQFREALRLAPDLLEARLNLGVALMNQNRNVEALAHLDEVLQRSPTNELALRYVRKLRGGARPP